MISATLGATVLSAGITFWVSVVAGVMLVALTAIMSFLTLAPRFSDTWAERLGENTDREKAVDYRDVIEDEAADNTETDTEAAGELEDAKTPEVDTGEEPEKPNGEPAT